MLPLQRKIYNHKRQLKLKALAGAFTVYGCMLFFIFFATYQSRDVVKLSVSRHGTTMGSPVLFMTRPKNVGSTPGTLGIKSKQELQKKSTKNTSQKPAAKKNPQKKKNVQKPAAQKEQKRQVKKNPEKPVKKKPTKTNPSLSAQKKEVKAKKKAVPQKSASQRPVIKGPVKKEAPVPKKPQVEQKKIVPKKLTQKKDVVSQEQPQKQKKTFAQPAEQEQKAQKKIDGVEKTEELGKVAAESVLHVSEGYDNGTKAQIALSRAIARSWHPPHGLAEDLSSVLAVHLRADGSVEDVEIEEKSGVLAYDMAARGALWRVNYPRDFWGKTIAISFGAQR